MHDKLFSFQAEESLCGESSGCTCMAGWEMHASFQSLRTSGPACGGHSLLGRVRPDMLEPWRKVCCHTMDGVNPGAGIYVMFYIWQTLKEFSFNKAFPVARIQWQWPQPIVGGFSGILCSVNGHTHLEEVWEQSQMRKLGNSIFAKTDKVTTIFTWGFSAPSLGE